MNQKIIILLLAIEMFLIVTDIIKMQKEIEILKQNQEVIRNTINSMLKNGDGKVWRMSK